MKENILEYGSCIWLGIYQYDCIFFVYNLTEVSRTKSYVKRVIKIGKCDLWLEILLWVILAVDNSSGQSGTSNGTYLTEELQSLNQEIHFTSRRFPITRVNSWEKLRTFFNITPEYWPRWSSINKQRETGIVNFVCTVSNKYNGDCRKDGETNRQKKVAKVAERVKVS